VPVNGTPRSPQMLLAARSSVTTVPCRCCAQRQDRRFARPQIPQELSLDPALLRAQVPRATQFSPGDGIDHGGQRIEAQRDSLEQLIEDLRRYLHPRTIPLHQQIDASCEGELLSVTVGKYRDGARLYPCGQARSASWPPNAVSCSIPRSASQDRSWRTCIPISRASRPMLTNPPW